MTDKKKKIERAGRGRFVAIWAWANMAAWLLAVGSGLLIGTTGLEPVLRSSMLVLALLTGVIPAFFLAGMQKLVVERYLRRTMSGWIGISVTGGLAAGLLMYLYISAPVINPALSFVPLLMPVAVLQWYWLSQRVKSSWLWLAAGMSSVLLFTLPAQLEFAVAGASTPFAMLAFILNTILSGAAMYYLWTQDDHRQNQMTEDAFEEAMLNRLSDKTGISSGENPDDDQAQQEEHRHRNRQQWSWVYTLFGRHLRRLAFGR